MSNDFLKYKQDGKGDMLLRKFDLWANYFCYWPWAWGKFVVSSLK